MEESNKIQETYTCYNCNYDPKKDFKRCSSCLGSSDITKKPTLWEKIIIEENTKILDAN